MTAKEQKGYLGIPGCRKVAVATTMGTMAYITAGSGPVVMLLHGLGTTSETWFRSIGPLAERFTVIAPDLWGHGDSAGPRVLTKVEPLMLGVEALRVVLGVERIGMVGHSLGGLVAARYTLEHRDRVGKLALVDAGGIGEEMSWLMALSSIPKIGWLVFLPAEIAVRLYGRFVFNPPGEVKVSLLKSLHRSKINHASADAVRRAVQRGAKRLGPAKDNFLLPRLDELDIPVHIFWGHEDRLFPVSQLEGVRKACPEVAVHVFADVGHWPYAEVPDEFNKLLLDFLAAGDGW